MMQTPPWQERYQAELLPGHTPRPRLEADLPAARPEPWDGR